MVEFLKWCMILATRLLLSFQFFISFFRRSFFLMLYKHWHSVMIYAYVAFFFFNFLNPVLQLSPKWCCRNCEWNRILYQKSYGRNKWNHVRLAFLTCSLEVYVFPWACHVFVVVIRCIFLRNRYSIFCKAAYAELKASSHSVIAPVECKMILFVKLAKLFPFSLKWRLDFSLG